MIIGIIGGIGSGKSTVSEILKELGLIVVDCDSIYKSISLQKSYIEIIEKHFPTAVINGNIDRTILGNIVFNDKNKMQELNSIAHPLIKQEITNLAKTITSDLYIEVPVFIGSGLENFFDRIILVTAETKFRIDRVVARSGYTKEYAKKIILAQPLESELEKYANVIILNNKDKVHLKQEICKII